MTLRLPALLALLAALLLVPGAAQARPTGKVKRLGPAPATVTVGQTFTVTGKLTARTPRTASYTARATLRRSPNARAALLLGTSRLKVKGFSTRSFRIKATVPQAPVGTRLVLVVCGQRAGERSRSCAKAAPRTVVIARGPIAPPTPPLVGTDATPAAPAAPAPAPAPAPAGTGTTETGPTGTGTTGSTGAAGCAGTPGARSAGDSLFPTIGNGGYDATHYDLALDYRTATRALQATATMTATATQDLSQLTLDLQNGTAKDGTQGPALAVSAVTVDGAPVPFSRADTKLVIDACVPKGRAFTVVTSYGGTMRAVTDPDGSQEGWVPTPDGADAVGEPIGAQGWFPNNNRPDDKATYRIATTVAAGTKAISNGTLVSQAAAGTGRTTFTWAEDKPMASYLATVVIGAFQQTTDTTSTPGRPYYTSYDTAFLLTPPPDAGRVPAILSFFETLYGAYPFSSAGGTFDNNLTLGYSLETQSKPLYPTADIGVDTIAHENAHMWFGDAVTLGRWRDIWLNEGMTEFSTWFWGEKQNREATTKARFDAFYADTTPGAFWRVPPADPATPADIFDTDAMYNRGAMVCEAVRQILGESTFFAMQRRWQAEHAYANATTEDWIALVKDVSSAPDARWDEFFRQWLFTSYTGTGKPSITPASFGA